MATSPTAQDTTAATLAGLPFATVRGIVETMQAVFPAERERIGRGATVLLTAKIFETAETGVYLVQSAQFAELYYQATSLQCCCPDAKRHPEQRCKHSWALDVLSVASAIASRERAEAAAHAAPPAAAQDADVLDLDPDAPIPYVLTAQAEAALDQPEPTFGNVLLDGTCPTCGAIGRVVHGGYRAGCEYCFG